MDLPQVDGAASVLGRHGGRGREPGAKPGPGHQRRPDAPPDAEIYAPFAQFPLPSLAFTVRTSLAPESLVPAIRSELAQLDPTLPLASVRV